jgi:hypothetical protein
MFDQDSENHSTAITKWLRRKYVTRSDTSQNTGGRF